MPAVALEKQWICARRWVKLAGKDEVQRIFAPHSTLFPANVVLDVERFGIVELAARVDIEQQAFGIVGIERRLAVAGLEERGECRALQSRHKSRDEIASPRALILSARPASSSSSWFSSAIEWAVRRYAASASAFRRASTISESGWRGTSA